jgi:hypothetical protein
MSRSEAHSGESLGRREGVAGEESETLRSGLGLVILQIVRDSGRGRVVVICEVLYGLIPQRRGGCHVCLGSDGFDDVHFPCRGGKYITVR